eukprot:1157943-Pelagomonas_calceolata.AAC.2
MDVHAPVLSKCPWADRPYAYVAHRRLALAEQAQVQGGGTMHPTPPGLQCKDEEEDIETIWACIAVEGHS